MCVCVGCWDVDGDDSDDLVVVDRALLVSVGTDWDRELQQLSSSVL